MIGWLYFIVLTIYYYVDDNYEIVYWDAVKRNQFNLVNLVFKEIEQREKKQESVAFNRILTKE